MGGKEHTLFGLIFAVSMLQPAEGYELATHSRVTQNALIKSAFPVQDYKETKTVK